MAQRQLKIGDYYFLPHSGELNRDGEAPAYLQQKAANVLLVLAEQSGELVTRNEIVQRVWGDTVVTDDSLNRCIADLRRALGDTPRRPSYIQTAARRGYRCIADVSEVPASDAAVPTDSPATTEAVNESSVTDNSPWAIFLRDYFGRACMLYVAICSTFLGAVSLLVESDLFLSSALVYALAFTIGAAPPAYLIVWIAGGRGSSAQVTRNRAAILTTILLSSTAAVSWLWVMNDGGADQKAPNRLELANVVATLPFNVDSAAEAMGLAYLGAALPFELNMRLTELGKFQVMHESATRDAYQPGTSALEAANILGAEYVIQGEVAGAGKRARVWARMLHVGSETVVWAVDSQLDTDDLVQLQSTFLEAAVNALSEKFRLGEPARGGAAVAPGTQNAETFDTYMEALAALLGPRSGDSVDEAIRLFRLSLDGDPRFGDAQAGLCEAYLAKSRIDRDESYLRKAKVVCDTASGMRTGSVRVQIARAKLAKRMGSLQQAEDIYEQMLSHNPYQYDALLGMGDIRAAQKQGSEAADYYRRAIELQPGNWLGQTKFGFLRYDSGEYQLAAERFEKAATLTPLSRSVWLNLGSARFFAGDFDGATEAYEKVLGLESNANVHNNLGMVHLYAGRFSEAVAEGRTAVELEVNGLQSPGAAVCGIDAGDELPDAALWGNLALFEDANGNEATARNLYGTAICLAEKALSINVLGAERHADIATYHAALGNSARAQEHIDQALRLKGQDPDIHFLAGIVANYAGNLELARKHLESAATLGRPVTLIVNDPRLDSEVLENFLAEPEENHD